MKSWRIFVPIVLAIAILAVLGGIAIAVRSAPRLMVLFLGLRTCS
jgi:hypothetical protein